MRKVISSISFALIILIFTCNISIASDLGEVVFKIDPKKYGININYIRGTVYSGPTVFAIIGNDIAIGKKSKEILIIDKNGNLIRTIMVKDGFEHFDMDSNGDGFIGINTKEGNLLVHEIKRYNVQEKSLNLKFMKQHYKGDLLRIDLLPDRVVRFIAFFVKSFVVETPIEKLAEAEVKRRSKIEDIITSECPFYIGAYHGYHIFCKPVGKKKEYLQLYAFHKDDPSLLYSKVYEFKDKNWGCFIMWSYAYRMNAKEGCFYAMFYQDGHILIRKFNLNNLLGI